MFIDWHVFGYQVNINSTGRITIEIFERLELFTEEQVASLARQNK
jgi:hypothetical protein